MVSDAHQQFAQIGFGIEAVEFGGANQAVDGRTLKTWLREQLTLRFDSLRGSGAFAVIISYVVDVVAEWEAPHQLCVVWLE